MLVNRTKILQAMYKPCILGRDILYNLISAGLAQLVEQLICNQQVEGSSPLPSSKYGGMPEWLKGAVCKIAGLCLRRFKSYSLHHLFKGNNVFQI